jgi:hypothetical protein
VSGRGQTKHIGEGQTTGIAPYGCVEAVSALTTNDTGVYIEIMKEVVELLNKMIEQGVIDTYALFGAVAQMRYTEAVATMDADILVAMPNESELVSLSPIYSFCKSMGYYPEGDAVRVGEWPVQFIPVFDALSQAALEEAETGQIEDARVRVVRADYLAVIALSVGRNKDYLRILSLLESGAVSENDISSLSAKQGLSAEWKSFKERFLDED